MKWSKILLHVAAALTCARSGAACGTCGCGDATLTALGSEKPYQNRVRTSLELRYRSEEIGRANVDRISMREARADAHLAWAPHERAFIALSAPLVHRTVGYVNEAESVVTGVGDVALRVKAFVAQDSPAFPRHLLAVVFGLSVPTAAMQRDSEGALLPMEMQIGTGSWDPALGVSYAYFPRPWSFYSSVQGSSPLRDTATFRASPSLRASLSLQRQFSLRFAARLSVDTRLDAKAFENGQSERDSGGLVGFVSPELLLSPMPDVLLGLSARLPVAQALAGYHREGPIWGAVVSYDL